MARLVKAKKRNGKFIMPTCDQCLDYVSMVVVFEPKSESKKELAICYPCVGQAEMWFEKAEK